jgi:WD40 repeat protein
MPYQTGQYVGAKHGRSKKLELDPMMELEHVIGYSPNMQSIKWSRIPGEEIVIFTQGATLIAMDRERKKHDDSGIETLKQRRFFFGHSEPICCFDIANHGNMLASAQEGKLSVIRLWDYHNARCLTQKALDVSHVVCLSFSPDGRFLASVGKQQLKNQWKDKGVVQAPIFQYVINIWDISRIM